MAQFDEDPAINEIIQRVYKLNLIEKNLFIDTIKNINKKKEYSDEEKAERKRLQMKNEKQQLPNEKQKRLILMNVKKNKKAPKQHLKNAKLH